MGAPETLLLVNFEPERGLAMEKGKQGKPASSVEAPVMSAARVELPLHFQSEPVKWLVSGRSEEQAKPAEQTNFLANYKP